MTFKPLNEQRDVIATKEIGMHPGKTNHLLEPLTTKSWHQTIDNSSMLQVIFEKLVMRDMPDNNGHPLLELPYNLIVKEGSEESQSTNDTIWKNIISDNIKGWVLAAGLVPYQQPTRITAIPRQNTPLKSKDQEREQLQQEIANMNGNSSDTISSEIVSRPPPTSANSTLYRVILNDLAMRAAPEIKSRILKKLQEGQLVAGLPETICGSWIAIHVDGHMGWVIRQWIEPISTKKPV